MIRGPKDRINIKIPHSGSKAHDKVDSRNSVGDPERERERYIYIYIYVYMHP